MKPVPSNLKKVSDVVDNDIVKKTVYDELIKNVNAIDASGLIKKQNMMLRSKILKIKYLILPT